MATVRFAADHGLRLAFNAGGHNAGPIDWRPGHAPLEDGAHARDRHRPGGTPRAHRGRRAGEAARGRGRRARARVPRRHVTGRRRGGLRARRGPQLDGPTGTGSPATRSSAADVVTADGRLVHIDRRHRARPLLGHPGRRRQRRRGDGPRARAGPGRRRSTRARCSGRSSAAAEILNAWRVVDRDGCRRPASPSGRLLQLPDAPFLPDHLRGRSFVLVEAAIIGSEADGAALIRPFRDLGPEFDTVALMPSSELSLVNMDPDFPLPYAGDGILLDDLPAAAIDEVVRAFVGAPLLHAKSGTWAAPRHVRSPDHGLLDAIDQPFVCFTFGFAPDAEASRWSSTTWRALLGGAGSVGQRTAVPQLRRVTDGPAFDLPGGRLRAPEGRQGGVRPGGNVRRQPRGRGVAVPPLARGCGSRRAAPARGSGPRPSALAAAAPGARLALGPSALAAAARGCGPRPIRADAQWDGLFILMRVQRVDPCRHRAAGFAFCRAKRPPRTGIFIP